MIVIDSSSLILLAKLNMLDVLIGNIKYKLVMPEQVYNECLARGDSFDAQIIEKRFKERLITKKDISNKNLYNKILNDFNLGKGEAEAITLCIEIKSGIISDDKKAINACRVLQINFTKVPRLIVQFHKRKIITKEEVNLLINKLQKFGRYSAEIINKLKEDLKWEGCKM